MVIKIIKYIINFAGLAWMMLAAMLSYGLIVRFPPCDRMMALIRANVWGVSRLYLFYIGLLTAVNFLVERRLEKRPAPKEYKVLALVQAIVLALTLTYYSIEFYSHCGEIV